MACDFAPAVLEHAYAFGADVRPPTDKCSRVKHGDCVGKKRAAEYITWRNMLKRCHNPNDDAYHHYGGRGIEVCERWRTSYAAFLADMGRKPAWNFSIDRIDVNGNYEPGNCRWADWATQNANRRYKDPEWSRHGGRFR
jgi:hypothetical protein